jgi:hypothetical protein
VVPARTYVESLMTLLDKFAEDMVDAVGEALGVDTGIIHEDKFKSAKKAAFIVLHKLLRNYA